MNNSKVEDLITLLTKETVVSNIKWNPAPAPAVLVNGTEYYYPSYFQTLYKGVVIGIYQRRYKSFTDEETYYWASENGICVISSFDTLLWDYDNQSPMLNSLFNAVSAQASKIDDILNSLLDGEI